MFIPRTTRRLILAIAAAAVSMTLVRSCRSRNEHPHYHANRGAMCRRLERWARQQAAEARAGVEETRRQMLTPTHRARFERRLQRFEADARQWERYADEWSRDAVDALKWARKGGDNPSGWPEHIRRELKPEDLKSPEG